MEKCFQLRADREEEKQRKIENFNKLHNLPTNLNKDDHLRDVEQKYLRRVLLESIGLCYVYIGEHLRNER